MAYFNGSLVPVILPVIYVGCSCVPIGTTFATIRIESINYVGAILFSLIGITLFTLHIILFTVLATVYDNSTLLVEKLKSNPGAEMSPLERRIYQRKLWSLKSFGIKNGPVRVWKIFYLLETWNVMVSALLSLLIAHPAQK